MTKKGCFLFFLPEKENTNKKEEIFPYKRKYLNSKAELSLFHILKTYLPEYEIMTKVRLEDIIQVKQGTENYNSFRGKIKSRHIDFAICKKEDLNVKTIIELDDKSHKNKTQKEKDRFKDNALKSAGISTIRIQAKNSYNVEELIKFIKSGFN